MSFRFDTFNGFYVCDVNDTNGRSVGIFYFAMQCRIHAYMLTCNCADFKCAKSNYKLYAVHFCSLHSFALLTENIRIISVDVIFYCRT